MTITGALDPSGQDLLLTRTITAPAPRIWEHLSRSELLATWFGTFTGDPSSGTVMVAMTAEPGEAVASEYTIHACEPERLLTVSSAMEQDTWRLSLELSAAPGGGDTAPPGGGDTGAPGGGDTTAPGGGDTGAADGAGSTQVVLRHHDVPQAMMQYIGPGWEWYLDRLTGAATGGEIPGMDVWDSRYMSLSEDYAALTR